MSRHDTPGTIVIGGNIVQQPDDKVRIQGGLGQAALNIPVDLILLIEFFSFLLLNESPSTNSS